MPYLREKLGKEGFNSVYELDKTELDGSRSPCVAKNIASNDRPSCTVCNVS
jgi:hypothetical protein